ncbi:hypothetical protein N1851_022001 [Merluccius polli]|uniref:Uncharacterized protein n=1 Tax=Merluccius polli TaxID=89951 RepID=A0AA47MIL2_MERPO|nr:hypothetical protein N1851_022001 [Merluccius polli]
MVKEKLLKSFGKWYRVDLNDKKSVKEILIQAETWMTSLEKSGLPGKYKAWGYQHGVRLPRLLWPLLVYKVPVSTVEGLERKMITYLRRWLGVLRGFRERHPYGKFRWLHDQILTQLAADVEQARKKPKQLSKGPWFIHFLRAGESAATETRSKGVLATASTKQVVLIELKVPWEEMMEEAHERKLKKYQALIFESQHNG